MPMPMQSSINVLPRLENNQPFYKNMDKYIAAQISCLYDYHVKHDLAQISQSASQHLTEWAGERIIERATNGDPEAIIDMALRYLGGCGTMRQSAEGALYVLDSLLDPACDRDRYLGYLASPTTLAQAHSCAANAHFMKLTASAVQVADMLVDERRFQRPQTAHSNSGGDPALAYLILAVTHANESAKLGLVSPIVLKIGLTARETGAKIGVDMARMGRSRYIRYLWRAVTARLEEIYDEERKKQKKVEDSPNDYVCAAEGCGIRAEGRAALRACAGRCPRDLKPYYCSKECQTKDWSRHKAVCKAGSVGKAPIITDKENALTFFQLVEEEEEESESATQGEEQVDATAHGEEDPADQPLAFGPPPGLTSIVDIPAPNAPGGPIEISSNTLEPEAMTALREGISKLTANDAAS
ncbi:hypothetical protein TRAPUB_9770 [Trametes pubescens]|uniref:MYND-type domain-containing protein n=1 Tax=Trametes pubescens TaxID=154538 RepID=A0A1M2W1D8_TRAPU|nr:hypothetical protein TRAPUB_9770 [Trametes pubescens]